MLNTLARLGGSFAKIDTHYHIIPEIYKEAVEKAGGDPSGFGTPENWTPENAIKFMNESGIRKAYVSVTSPGVPIAPANEQRALARKLNEFSAYELRDKYPGRFGVFGNLPDLMDVEGTFAEIDHCANVLKVDGFVLFTSYGKEHKYLGDDQFIPIWKKFNDLESVVFIHPSCGLAGMINKLLPLPISDYPHETCRTAADLVTSGRKRQFPHAKVILSHGGGTLPVLGMRLAGGAELAGSKLDKWELLKDFQSFYFDTALVASPSAIEALLKFARKDRILFGSDFPYAPSHLSKLAALVVIAYLTVTGRYGMLKRIHHQNAEKLFSSNRQRPPLTVAITSPILGLIGVVFQILFALMGLPFFMISMVIHYVGFVKDVLV